ncbi:MAG: hypothetical protein R2864_15495 [Syntrophotaleaceae bacterium]
MFLIPGGSAMGLRLLDSLPWEASEKRRAGAEHDQFGALPVLEDYHGEVAKRYSKADAPVTGYPDVHEQPPADQQSGNALISIPHTAPVSRLVTAVCMFLWRR